MEIELGEVKCPTSSPANTSLAMVSFASWSRCFLIIASCGPMCLVPSRSWAEFGRLAGLKSHVKWSASGAILRVGSE